jgi:hypothetical protein
MWLTDIERLRPELDAWNAGIERSKDEYAAHPRAACTAMSRWADARWRPCDEIATHGERCHRCDLAFRKAAARLRAYRTAKKADRRPLEIGYRQ